MKTLTLSIAAGVLAAVTLSAPAAPSSPGTSASAATSTKDSRALLNQRMRKCKVMTGDEKTACQKDAHADAKAEAHKQTNGAGK